MQSTAHARAGLFSLTYRLVAALLFVCTMAPGECAPAPVPGTPGYDEKGDDEKGWNGPYATSSGATTHNDPPPCSEIYNQVCAALSQRTWRCGGTPPTPAQGTNCQQTRNAWEYCCDAPE